MKFDPIADMLTRIRNALSVKHSTVDVPASKTKKAIADVLVKEGYIEKAVVLGKGVTKTIKITLKYGESGEKVVQGLKRISKPGLKVYTSSEEMPIVLNGLGIAVISTSKGIMSNNEAKKNNIGGEVLAFVW